MLGAELVVAVKQVVVRVVVSEFLEEEATPDLELLQRRHLLQLVNVAFFIVNVEGIQVVAC